MTYGWMLLVVAIVGGAVFSVVGDQSVDSISGFSGSDVVIDGFGVSDDDELGLDLNSGSSREIVVSKVNVSDSDTGEYVFKEFTGDNRVGVGSSKIFELPNVSRTDSGNQLDVNIIYDAGELSNMSVSGTITGSLGLTGSGGYTGSPEGGNQPINNGDEDNIENVETLVDNQNVTVVTGDPTNCVGGTALNNDGSVGLYGSADSTAYIANLSDPSNPNVTKITNPGDNVGSVALNGDGSVGLIAARDGGYILDLTDLNKPDVTKFNNAHMKDASLSNDGSVGLMTSMNSNAYVLNMSDLNNPDVSVISDPNEYLNDGKLSEDGSTGLLGSGSFDGIAYVLDLSNLNNPDVTKVSQPENQIHHADINDDGSVGFIAHNWGKGYVLDLSDLGNPNLTEVSATNTESIGLNDDGSVGMYGTITNSAFVLNLSNPNNPIETAEISDPTNDVNTLAFNSDGSVAALGTHNNNIYVMDLSDMNNPNANKVDIGPDSSSPSDISLDDEGSKGTIGSSYANKGYVLH